MHRFIMDAPEGLEVDHINHNTLDNRKSNLRVVNSRQNNFNTRPCKNSTSKYKHVYLSKNGKWIGQINYEGICKRVGTFHTEEEAGRVVDLKVLELRGEGTYLNFPELKEQYLKELNNRYERN